jgi:hypothetical protein
MKKVQLQRLQLFKDVLEEAVDRGVSSVQKIHETIADVPLEAMERAGVLTPQANVVRARQRAIISVVYDTIRQVTRGVGEFISEQIENLEEGGAVARLIEAEVQPVPSPARKPPEAPAPPAAAEAPVKKAETPAAEPPVVAEVADEPVVQAAPTASAPVKKPAAKKSVAKKLVEPAPDDSSATTVKPATKKVAVKKAASKEAAPDKVKAVKKAAPKSKRKSGE